MKLLKIFIVVFMTAILTLTGCNLKDRFIKKETKIDATPTVEVKKGDLTVFVREMGMIKAKDTVTIYAKTTGKIESILVPDGSMAKEGDILLKMDSTDFETAVTDKKLELEQKKANLLQAQEELKIMKTTSKLTIDSKISKQNFNKTELEIAQKDLEKEKRLYDEKIRTLQDIESSESNVRSKQNTVKQDEIDTNLEKENQQSKIIQKKAEIKLRQTEVAKAKIDYEKAKKQLEDTIIKAPKEGLVSYNSVWRGSTSEKYAEGDEVRNGEGLIQLPDLSNLIVNIPLRESEIKKVKKGQEVLLEIDTSEKLVFDGKIDYVSEIGEEPSWRNSHQGTPGQTKYALTVEILNNKQGLLRPGMKVVSNIITDKLENIIYIPNQCIFYKDKKAYVWLKTEKGFEEKLIEVGKNTDNYTEIKAGLKEGDIIALKAPEMVDKNEKSEKVIL